MRSGAALLVVALPLGLATGETAQAQAGPVSDPPVCREALEARPGDDLEALRLAEEDRWRAARSASRRGKALMRDSVGRGDTAVQRQRAAQIALFSERYRLALREARALCGCRERRGDPYRENCERLFQRYRGALGPPPSPPRPATPPDAGPVI